MAVTRPKKRDFIHAVARGVTLVDFNAHWCQPCRDQEPIVKALEKDFRQRARIEILDVDEYQEVALKLEVQSIPTIIIYRDGKEVNRFIGLQSSEILDRALRAVIGQRR